VHRTVAGDHGKPLKMSARELARDARALQKAARAPAATQGGAQRLHGRETILAEAEAFKHQAGLMAQIYLEEGHVSSGLRGFAPSHETVTLREDAIFSAQKRGLSFRTALCTVFSITSGDSQSILYDSDIRLHLPKLHRISRLDVFPHAFNFVQR